MTQHPFILIAALLAGMACSPTASPPTPPTDLGLGVVAADATSTNRQLLGKASISPRTAMRISKASLEKPLLYIQGYTTKLDPQYSYVFWDYSYYSPRLVQFSHVGNEVVMSDTLPREPFAFPYQATYKIIAVFPVLSDTGNALEFDFAKGMSDVGSWHLFFESKGKTPPTPSSFIMASQSTPSRLVVDQQFQVTHIDINATWSVRHIFSADMVHSSMSPRKPDETDRIGYFTTEPWYNAGNTVPHQYIQRWSLERPIRFAISTNTPNKFRESIIQGVLDWNKAFGQEILQVVDAPSEFAPLHPDIDIGIHWSENDDLALAYATFLPHPQTGQILHGDIIVYSGWIDTLKDMAKKEIPGPDALIQNPYGFGPATVCERDNSELIAALEAHPEVANNDQLRDRFMQTAMRGLMRHEMGHVLGLRHNFAGSLGGTMDDAALDAAWEDFLTGKDWQGPSEPSSSVMDYLPFTFEQFMPPMATYDYRAIQWGYFAKLGAIPDKDTPLFCTDKDAATVSQYVPFAMADCLRYDGGQNPLTYLSQEILKEIKIYSQKLIKITSLSQNELESTAPASSVPPIWRLSKRMTDLARYFGTQYSVKNILGHSPPEQRLFAKDIAIHYRDQNHWEAPELWETIKSLENTIRYGTTENALWAFQVLERITLGVKQLKFLLDPIYLPSKGIDRGAAADIHFGN